MRHPWWTAPATALWLGVVGCHDPVGDESRWADLRNRLDAIEGRLESAEAVLDPLEGARSTLDDIERRLGVLEARAERAVRSEGSPEAAAEQGAAAPAPGQPGTPPPTWPPMTQNKRQELRTLAGEYREKLAAIRAEYRHDLGNPERRDMMREASRWYRDERRRLLTGEEPPANAPNAQPPAR
jgi:hypothetical protein